MSERDRILAQVQSIVDFCSPICAFRKDFIIDWRAGGARYAYNKWSKKPGLLNIDLIPQLERFVDDAERLDTRP